MRNEFLKFSDENAKLEKSGLIIWHFSLPSGKTCPGACQCKAWVNKQGKLVDGPDQKFRCFSAEQEARWPTVNQARSHNLRLLLKYGGATAEGLHRILADDFPATARYFRIHIGGDFYSQAYFDAWVKLAGEKPHVKFYAYTKSLEYWVARLPDIPVNLVLTASQGGLHDRLIEKHGLKTAVVVGSEEEAEALGLKADHDDLMALDDNVRAAALIIHGNQQPGTWGSEAAAALRRRGVNAGYRSSRYKTPKRKAVK